jgi:hypothetical protein
MISTGKTKKNSEICRFLTEKQICIRGYDTVLLGLNNTTLMGKNAAFYPRLLYPRSPKGRGYSVLLYPHSPKGEGVYCFTSVRLSVQDIFRHIFLSNCWWQKSDIWSQASYRYTILSVAFLGPSDSHFLFGDLVGFYIHLTYMQLVFIYIEHICTLFVTFFSATIDGRNLILGHKLHIGTPYRLGSVFLTRQIPTSCLPNSSQFILF